jgi:predicted dehydrogenase
MPLRLAILGPGGIAARHAAAAAALPDDLALVAVCGRDAGRTEAFAATHGGRAFTDFAAMLDDASPDLLVVALPPFAHAGQVEAAAARGIHLLVEKPIALDLDRAAGMVAAARPVVAACGFMYRFGAAVERWEQTDAGRALHFSGAFHCNALHAPWWRSLGSSGGQMVEQLIHLIDLVRHTLGMPETVYARAANLGHRDVPGYTAEDVSAIILGYADGRIGVLHASNVAVPGRWTKQWQIAAERATGSFSDWNTAEITLHAGASGGAVERVASARNVFEAQLADLVGAIRGGRPPRVPLSEGLDSLRIALAARQSASERREIVLAA